MCRASKALLFSTTGSIFFPTLSKYALSVRKTQIYGSVFCHTLRIPNYSVCSPLLPFLFLVWRKLLASTSNVFFIWFPRLLVHYEILCPIVFVFRQIESYSPHKWHVFISVKTEQFFVLFIFFYYKWTKIGAAKLFLLFVVRLTWLQFQRCQLKKFQPGRNWRCIGAQK